MLPGPNNGKHSEPVITNKRVKLKLNRFAKSVIYLINRKKHKLHFYQLVGKVKNRKLFVTLHLNYLTNCIFYII